MPPKTKISNPPPNANKPKNNILSKQSKKPSTLPVNNTKQKVRKATINTHKITNSKTNANSSSEKELIKTLKSRIESAYNKFILEYGTITKSIYAGKTEQDETTRHEQHLNGKRSVEFKNSECIKLEQFPELKGFNKQKGQRLICELEKYLISLVNIDVKQGQFKGLNNTDESTGGKHNKGDLQKLYLIINKNY